MVVRRTFRLLAASQSLALLDRCFFLLSFQLQYDRAGEKSEKGVQCGFDLRFGIDNIRVIDVVFIHVSPWLGVYRQKPRGRKPRGSVALLITIGSATYLYSASAGQGIEAVVGVPVAAEFWVIIRGQGSG